jgi:hypothetical protein
MIPLPGQLSCNAVATANRFPESNAATAGTLPYLATVAAVAYPSAIAITDEFASFCNPSDATDWLVIPIVPDNVHGFGAWWLGEAVVQLHTGGPILWQAYEPLGPQSRWQAISEHVFGRNAMGELIHYYWSPRPSWAAENLAQRPTIGAAYRIASDPAVVYLVLMST